MMPTVLVTGASGFVGRPLCSALARLNYNVKAAMRTVNSGQVFEERIEPIIGDVAYSDTNVWRHALTGVDTVIHLAACVHQTGKVRAKEAVRLVNTRGTSRLCRLAVEGNVRRFIYLSTVKVNGESASAPISEKDPANPQDLYAASKWEAEKQISKITRGSACDFVILRPPLVYGPRVKANFLNLLKLVSADIPLPLGKLHNRRSMIYIGNLVDAVITAMENPQASGQVFMVSDGNDLTVAELIAMLARAMGNKPRLFAFPVGGLYGLFRLMGKRDQADKLCQPLVVDSSRIGDVVGWQPPYTVNEGIGVTVAWFRNRKTRRIAAL